MGGFLQMPLIGLSPLASVLIFLISKLANTAEKEGEEMNV